MTIGEQIKKRRKASGMTQAQLSARSGVSQQMLSKLEQNIAKSTSDVVALAGALGCSAEELVSGTAKKRSPATDERAVRMAQKFQSLTPARRDLIVRLIDELAD